MLFGDWPEAETDARLEDNTIVHFDMIFRPPELAPDQPFQIVGTLSGLISRRFQLLTTEGEVVTALSPRVEPGSLAIPIPDLYKSSVFPIFRLSVQPPARRSA
jgi:hypothetical protein